MTALKRILLAEDDANDRELTLAALEENNVVNAVDVVTDGAEALDYLFRRGAFADRDTEPPVVVLLDIKMPKVDGVEVLRQAKNDPELKIIPVVMLTSSRQERDVLQSYCHGANAYVVKPVGFENFVQAIKELGMFWAVLNEPPIHSQPSLSPQRADHPDVR